MKINRLSLKNHANAILLIQERMRVPIVHSMTGIELRSLRQLWLDTHKTTPSPGRLPTSVLSFVQMGASPCVLSTFVSVYLSKERQQIIHGQNDTLTDMFLGVWNARNLFFGDTRLDINAAWYAARDVKAGIVAWGECNRCKAKYIFDTGHRATSRCPYCGEKNLTILGKTNEVNFGPGKRRGQTSEVIFEERPKRNYF